MILALLAALQVSAADSLPRITLAEALAQGVRLSPNYVASIGSISSAEWSRKAATLAFIIPSVTAVTDYGVFSPGQFNVATAQVASTNATLRLFGSLDLFTGGRRFAEVARAKAELEGAHATEVQARYDAALSIEGTYYEVLGSRELLEVARGRERRATEQLAVARARVVSGAAVQSDSLQLVLELNESRVSLLRAEAAVRSTRLQLGRLTGRRGAVDAVPLDTADVPDLPVSLPDAVGLALQQGPEYRIARANETQSAAVLKARKAAYLPTATVSGSFQMVDENWFPDALKRRSALLAVSLPLWDNGVRELNVIRARAARDVTRAVREDLERGAEADVTTAYDAFLTARASFDLDRNAVLVARENFRVQDTRYRAGATTILDLLEAQDQLTASEANLVRSRYATRFAVAGLEAILGRRLLKDRTEP